MERLIFHIDVNSAFLSWEAARRVAEGLPDLREIPSAIGGDPFFVTIHHNEGCEASRVPGVLKSCLFWRFLPEKASGSGFRIGLPKRDNSHLASFRTLCQTFLSFYSLDDKQTGLTDAFGARLFLFSRRKVHGLRTRGPFRQDVSFS
jgi:hypothetical protein